VHADFEFYGAAVGLTSCCIYGGTPYRTQEMALRKGVDIVVGAPGRIKVNIIIR
jgi:ATP-dependent RNA helicase DDX21